MACSFIPRLPFSIHCQDGLFIQAQPRQAAVAASASTPPFEIRTTQLHPQPSTTRDSSLTNMSIAIDKILAASPNTERGRPTQLSTDPKGERVAYAVSDLF